MVFAYLDPAAGGMLIQTLVAAAVAVPFILRTQISRGLARLRGRKMSATQSDTENPTSRG